MTIPQKGSRTINIDGIKYRWTVSPDSGYMWLIVEQTEASGQRLEAYFEYHDVHESGGQTGRITGQRRSISPTIVRDIIVHALANGWKPQQRGLKPARLDGEAILPIT